MLEANHIDEIRRICRLEALRSAVLSVASESLDINTPQLVVRVSLDSDQLVATFGFCDPEGFVVAGGDL